MACRPLRLAAVPVRLTVRQQPGRSKTHGTNPRCFPPAAAAPPCPPRRRRGRAALPVRSPAARRGWPAPGQRGGPAPAAPRAARPSSSRLAWTSASASLFAVRSAASASADHCRSCSSRNPGLLDLRLGVRLRLRGGFQLAGDVSRGVRLRAGIGAGLPSSWPCGAARTRASSVCISSAATLSRYICRSSGLPAGAWPTACTGSSCPDASRYCPTRPTRVIQSARSAPASEGG